MYIPHTDADREEMLKTIGVKSLEDLFGSLPKEQLFRHLNLPPAITEMEAFNELKYIASVNETTENLTCFLGAGAYNHYIPAAVDQILRRGEFYTAYTPYQPEISQGTLQAIFEYQSLISAITGMDVSNASHYDGATAVAEAVNMAYHQFRGKRKKFILSPGLNPQYLETVHTYIPIDGIQFLGEDLPLSSPPSALYDLIDEETALIVVQYPDFFGRIYDYTQLIRKAHDTKTLVAIHVNPLSLGILKTPGAMDADIVTAEGQPLGIPLAFGGPYLGIFASKKEYVRKMAGRIVGETRDNKGNRGYVLTLSTREQHIRREKATSNICSNQGLMTLAVAVYLSLLGKQGLRQVATLNYDKAHYAADAITSIPGFELVFDTPFFNEFTIKCPVSAKKINEYLLDNDIIGGLDLSEYYPALKNQMLIAVTEMISRDDIDALVDLLSEVAK
ncbi:MAG: aminomethyl-transferring glycine dehydrogenase subunit GcvPA [Anaerolineales bacterium]|nr:aminomethyl-transferring glycine dehydrogenase subunit GcvPA [Anaerolineales bacterium]